MKGTLAGFTVLVCRPKIQSERLMQLFAAQGANPVLFTPIAILPQPKKLSELNEVFLQADWVVFVSPSAIDVTAQFLDFRRFNGQLFCVGKPSADKLMNVSGKTVYYPQNQSDSTALLQLSIFEQAFGKKVLIVRGEGGRGELIRALNDKGAQVFVEEVYQRTRLPLDWKLFESLVQNEQIKAVCVTSAEIAEILFMEAPVTAQAQLSRLLFLVPHERIQERLQRLGAQHIIVTEAGDENMVHCLIGVINSL